MTTIRPQCFECARLRRDGDNVPIFPFECEAFGEGIEIPRDIQVNEFEHTKPYPGDHGMMFVQLEKVTK